MLHPLVRRLAVILIAVLVTAGIGLSAVQASTMGGAMTQMDAALAMAAKCKDCDDSGDAKGMMACLAPACTAQVGAQAPQLSALDLEFLLLRHPARNPALLGRDAVPDPYPPRTTDIG